MPALSFTSNWAEPIVTGRKTSTIRTSTKIKQGDTLHMFCGAYRPGERRRLTPLAGVVCLGVSRIEIRRVMVGRAYGLHAGGSVTIDSRPLFAAEICQLLVGEGFSCAADFFHHFTPDVGDTFHGQLIRWNWWGDPIDATDPRIWKPEATR